MNRPFLFFLALSLAACGGGPLDQQEGKPATAQKRPAAADTAGNAHPVLLFGIDGATRTIMDPLMKEGRLPHFKALADRGVYEYLGTRTPTISPIIWTSIATGKVPEKHGINGFTAPIPDTERTSSIRLPKAHRRLVLELSGFSAKGLPSQKVTFMAGQNQLGSMALSDKEAKTVVTIEPPPEDRRLEFTFERSKRQGRSPIFHTARLRIRVTVDDGKKQFLKPEDGIERVAKATVSIGGKDYLDFSGPRRIVTVSSNMRRVKAVWNILSDAGRKVMVAGFWVTWPAEKVNGIMISSYTSARFGGSKKGTFLRDFRDQTYPKDLARSLMPILAKAAAHARNRGEEAARRYGASLKAMPADQLKPRNRIITPGIKPYQKKDPRDIAEQLVWAGTSDEFYALSVADLWPREHPDLAMVYLGEVDVVSHDYWDLDPSLTTGIIAKAYEQADASLGLILDAMGAEAKNVNIVICSDHGFSYDKNGIFDHQATHPPGTLIMAGPDIRKGGKPKEPGVLDIGPTLLALAGMPAAKDMDGRPLSEVLTKPPLPPVATYETGPPKPPQLPIESPVDEKVKDQLRFLGYIE